MLKVVKKQIEDLTARSEDLESFTAQALQIIGNFIEARCLTLSVRNSGQDSHEIHASLSRKHKEWKFTVDDTYSFYQQSRTKHSIRPAYMLRSHFCFHLNLPSKWSGTFQIEYPGIRILPHRQYKILTRIIKYLSHSLHIVLINQELERARTHLQEEEMINRELREFMANLSKELYCLSSVSTVLGQSHDVAEILSRVIETTLPFLKAEFGAIYLPETEQCFSFRTDGARYQRSEDSLLRSYFESSPYQFGILSHSSGKLPATRFIYDRPLSPYLKGHLDAMGIRSTFEFSLCSRNELFGLGLFGFTNNQVQAEGKRLFMITLNMTGLFLENISLVRDLERQVKLKSQEILEMERQHRFLYGYLDHPFSSSRSGSSAPGERILDEIEHSRKMTLLGELASGLAHQIRNPLNNLVTALHLIKDKDTPEEEKRELFDQLTERMETMNRMISEFIQYTRIPKLNLTSESVNDVLKNTVRAFKGWTDLASVEVITSFDLQLSLTRIDLCLINQVCHNIIKNALEAMYSHGQLRISTRKLKIRHGPEPRLEFLEILFRDSGPGIPQKDIDKVLNPFYSRKKDGMGLGLSVVDHVIRAHGGGVRIKSRPDLGTDVTLWLPIR